MKGMGREKREKVGERMERRIGTKRNRERERERKREREDEDNLVILHAGQHFFVQNKKKRERERERESEIFCLTDAFRSLECNLNFAPSISVLRLCCFQFTPCQMRDR